MTPQEHIQMKVIELAKEHIVETDETISEIAYTLGFQYPQHLSRLFKKRVGCTPMNIDCKMYSFEKGYIEHRDRTPVQLLFGK